MTSVLSSCFSDLKYGIRKQEEMLVTVQEKHSDDDDIATGNDDDQSGHIIEKREYTYVYIYLDGDSFFRLNLTPPYWGTVSVLQTVPPPHVPPEGKGDAVDWAIFILILMGTLFGFLVMLHQVGIVIDKRLRFRRFFKPMGNDHKGNNQTGQTFDFRDYDKDMLEEENRALKRGRGFPHSFSIDAIPTSMGGQRSHNDGSYGGGLTLCAVSTKDTFQQTKINASSGHNDHPCSNSRGECYDFRHDAAGLEMANRCSDNHGLEEFDMITRNSDLPASLRIKRDNPDLVEHPSLKSMSKIAMPQLSPSNDNQTRPSIERINDRPPLPL